jgi:hypothetical protein
VDPPSVSYERSFAGVGDAGPDMDHELRIEAGDVHGKITSAVCAWTDHI